jgi:hypothetical protein
MRISIIEMSGNWEQGLGKLVCGVGGVALSLCANALTAGEGVTAAQDVFFGDMHLHTRYSNDAFAFMTTRTPHDAYRFAKGEALEEDGGGSIRCLPCWIRTVSHRTRPTLSLQERAFMSPIWYQP